MINLLMSYSHIEISDECFEGCSDLSQIKIPSTISYIGKNAFNGCCLLTKIEIPTSVSSIGEGSFKKCISLKEINIPPIVTKIENDTFFDCSSLTHCNIPSSIKSIELYAFYGCTSLKEIIIKMFSPSELDLIINEYTFKCCYYFVKFSIPNNSLFKKIKREAFCECKNFTSFYVPNKLKVIPKKYFSFTALEILENRKFD